MPVGMIKRWLPVFSFMGIIFYASSIPGSNVPSVFWAQEIAYHFFVYLALSLFFSRALKYTFPVISIGRVILFASIFGIIYGLSDEWHQSFVPYRTVSGFDVFIDSLGSISGSLSYLFAFRLADDRNQAV